MSDSSNGGADAGAETGVAASGEQAPPRYRIVTQYVKDLSFESPRPPAQLPHTIGFPEIGVSVNVNSRGLDAERNTFEVELVLEAKATKDGDVVFIVEVVYAAVMELINVPDELKPPITLIEGPRFIFPYARRVISDVVRDGGFPPVLLEPIDFNALYRQHAAGAGAEAQQAATSDA